MDKRRAGIIVAIVLAALLIPTFVYEQARADSISKGVTAAGVGLGGLTRAQAHAKLERDLTARVMRPVHVIGPLEKATLTPADAAVKLDVAAMVDQAVSASHGGFFVVSGLRNALGMSRDKAIPNQVTFSRQDIKQFVRSVANENNRKTVNPHVTFAAAGLGEVNGARGIKVKQAALRRAVVTAFTDPTAARRIHVPVVYHKPKTTRRQLAKKFPTVITIDRGNFKLRLWKNLKLAKTYPIAVGMAGLETPAGLYHISDREVDPPWHVPNSAWAGDLAGKTIPPGPDDPIKARWLGVAAGVGIHGTDEPGSIGSAASHGCIRMRVPDVIALFPHVPMGAPVFIGN